MYKLYRVAEGRLVYWGQWSDLSRACGAMVELRALSGARCLIKDGQGDIVADTEV